MNLALPGIFGAGLLTFASPCVLPLIPLYLSFLTGTSVSELKAGGGGRVSRLWAAALAFSAGLTVVFVALGMVATAAGALLTEHRVLFLQLGGVALVVVGLKQLGLLRIPLLDRESRPWLGKVRQGGTVLGAFLFGAAFALGWTPCVGPVLGAVLTYTASATSEPAMGALYLGVYAAGLAAPLLGVAAAAPLVLRWLERARAHLRTVEVATGVLLAAFGVVLFTDSLDALSLPEPAVAEVKPAAPAAAATSAEACSSEGADGTCALPEEGFAVGAKGASPLEALSGPTMVEFVSSGCPVCKRMEPVVAIAERLCAGAGVHVLRLDVGTPDGRLAARQHGVRGVPTFLFVDGAGQVAARKVGEQDLASLQRGLEEVGSVQCAGLMPAPVDGAAAGPRG